MRFHPGPGQGDQDQQHGKDHQVVDARLHLHDLANGVRNALVPDDLPQHYRVGGGQRRPSHQRRQPGALEQSHQRSGSEKENDGGARTQHQDGDAPASAQSVALQPHDVQKEDEGERQGGHHLQHQIVSVQLEQAPASQQESQALEHEGEGERRPLHQSRGEGRDQEDRRENSEPEQHARHCSVRGARMLACCHSYCPLPRKRAAVRMLYVLPIHSLQEQNSQSSLTLALPELPEEAARRVVSVIAGLSGGYESS